MRSRARASPRDAAATARTLDRVATLVVSGVPPPRAWELVGGFPGSVLAELTYSLLPGGVWDIVLNANASSRTRKTSLSDP